MGLFQKIHFIDGGYNLKKILEVEALRFITKVKKEIKSTAKDKRIKKLFFWGHRY